MRAGKVDLHTAQHEMATDWVSAYKKYISPTPHERHAKVKATDNDNEGSRAEAGNATATSNPAAASTGQVWVNLKSGVIWKPGSQYYGKTKEGKYMGEKDALAAGYHEAK